MMEARTTPNTLVVRELRSRRRRRRSNMTTSAWCFHVVSFVLLCVASASAGGVPPVIIVPGDGSNQLEAKLDKPSTVHFFCEKKSDWYRLWLNTADLLATTSCWADNIRLVVDPKTGRATNAPGVTTRVPGWGTTSGFEELDPSIPAHATAAFRQMCSAFADKGWERNVTLRGAPYDFRYTPDSNAAFGANLKTLIEDVVTSSSQKVNLVSHSMGGLQTLYFLKQQTQSWKDAHIARWVAISAPYAGSASEVRLFASGNNEGLPVSSSSVRDEQRSYETNIWMLPNQAAFGDTVLLRTDAKNYSAVDYTALFNDVGYPLGNIVRQRVGALLPHIEEGPGVPVVCMYSTGVPTPASYYYPNGDFSKDPKTIINGDGDGTVNVESLKVCANWATTQTQSVDVRVYSGVNHVGMIQNSTVIQDIIALLL